MPRKGDIEEVDRAAREVGMPPQYWREFKRYLHRCKASGDRGTKNSRGDYTYAELLEKAEEFKDGCR